MGIGVHHVSGVERSGIAHVFWVDPCQLQLQAEEINSILPSVPVLGLSSQLQQFSKVYLWTYGRVTGAPPGCDVHDAH